MSSITYRPEIDGLRAIAVGAVIAFHVGIIGPSFLPLSGGQLGVDIFFVISGYLTTRLLLESRERAGRKIIEFYLRRARRILPAAVCMFVLVSLAGCILLIPSDLTSLARSVAASLFFVSNFYFLATTGYFAEPAATTPLLHTWSLAVEEQFYLVFPLLLSLLSSRPRRLAPAIALMSLVSIALALALLSRHADAVFYLLPTRAWELLAGSLVAALPLKHRFAGVLASAGLILVVLAVCYGGTSRGIGLGNVAAVVGTMMLIWFGGNQDPASRLLASSVLVGVGLISYSLYLWHQPLLAFIRLTSWNTPTPLQVAAVVAATVALSVLSYFLVERPFRARTMSWSAFWSTLIPACALVLVIAGFVQMSGGLPSRFSADVQRLLASNFERGVASRDGKSCSERPVGSGCILGDDNARPKIALVGDSHAEALSGALDAALAVQGLSALMLTKPSCPFIEGVEAVNGSVACSPFIAAVEQALVTFRINEVIIQDRAIGYIAGSRFDNGEGGMEPGAPFPVAPVGFSGTDQERVAADLLALKQTILSLRRAGIGVYLVMPVPEAGWNVPRAVAHAAATGHLPVTLSLDRYLERTRPIFDLLPELRQAGVIPIFPSDVLCDATTRRCRTHDASSILYNDTDHLSRAGAQLVVGAIMAAMDGLPAEPKQSG